MTTNIAYDGNYLFWSEYNIYTGWNKTRSFETENDEILFIQSVAKKFFYAINQLPHDGQVIFCLDSKSWRKGVEIPGGGYKKSREDKNTMDKATSDKFFYLMDQFGQVLEGVGVIVSRYPGAEGDDLLYLWSERFYQRGENTIIISGDRDVTQLVKMSHTPNDMGIPSYEPWVVVWNNNSKHNKLYIPRGWREKWLASPDTDVSIFNFNPSSSTRDDMKKFIRDQMVNLEPTDPDSVVMNKILGGDDGDDVPPAWIAMTKNKAGELKPTRLTGQKPGKVIDEICTRYSLNPSTLMFKWEDEEFMDYLAGVSLRITKDVDSEENRALVRVNLMRNAKLVWLTESQLPYNLIGGVNMHIDNALAENETQKQRWNWKSALAGTKYEKDVRVTPSKYDPFSDLPAPF